MTIDVALKILKIVTVETGKHVRNAGEEIIAIKPVFRYSAIPTVKLGFMFKTFVCR